MVEMNSERWLYTQAYLRDVFGAEDDHLRNLTSAAEQAGMPSIAVSADVGRLLHLLTTMVGATRALEIGTLAGYSATWIARGLADGGKLLTIERDPIFADFAEEKFAQAGLSRVVEVRRGGALELLPKLAVELGPRSLDLVFFDGEKSEYPDYWTHVRPLLRVGGLLLADNVLGTSSWWIDHRDHPQRMGADRLNRALAGDPDFEAVAVPIREGLLIARRCTASP